MSKFKKCTLRFFDELEKEAKKLEKSNPEDTMVLNRVLSLRHQPLEFALEDILEALESLPFLKIPPETIHWAEMAIQSAKVWPAPRNYR
jgi:hypothetical protein